MYIKSEMLSSLSVAELEALADGRFDRRRAVYRIQSSDGDWGKLI